MRWKCLSVRQPYAGLIFAERGKRKTAEVRSRNTAHRGRLLIHAGRLPERAECERLGMVCGPTGVILGYVDLLRTERVSEKRWRETRGAHLSRGRRPYGKKTHLWHFERPVLFTHPVPWKGRLNIFTVPADALKPVRVPHGKEAG